MNTPAAGPADESQARGIAPGSDLYYTFLFEHRERRRRLEAVAALGASLGAVEERCSDPGVARIKLAWWREEFQRLSAGAPRHPLCTPLARSAEAERARVAGVLTGLAQAAEHNLSLCSAPAEALLERHCRAVGGALWSLLAELCGSDGAAATRLGTALERTRLLLGTREDLSRVRLRLPAELLARHGVEPAAPRPAALGPALAEAVGALRVEFAACEEALAAAGGPLCARVAAALAQALLAEVEADGCALLERQVLLTPLRRLWIAWRVRRRHGPPEP